jgi:MSHA biogenesis protein MshQ
MRLHARHDGSGIAGGLVMLGQDEFVSRPAGFTISDVQRTSGSFANPAAIDATGPAFIRAGEDITLTVTARNASGNATPNFGKESPAEGVDLTSALVSGLGLSANPALGNGLIAGAAFTAGAATPTNVSWGEVGIITITPRLGDGDYLGTGADVIGTASGNVGRFTPHNFAVAVNDPTFATACTAGGFTYVGQSFAYASGMEPVLTATARNLAGGTTLNYSGTSPASQAFFKITTGSLTGKTYAAASGTLDASAATAPDPAIVAGGNGTGTLTFNSGSGLFFTRSTPQSPFNAEISLAINVIDTDGVAYSTNPARFGQITAGNGIAFSTGKTMRFGRLRLSGASGSQLLPLHVPFEVQHWTGTFFATNTADTCTTITSGDVGLGNYIGSVHSGNAAVTAVSALSGGRGTITLGAPGAGGSVDVAINLGVGTDAAACPAFTPTATPAALAHLRGQWCGAAYDKDPSARVRFGIRSGGDERIYMRENY